MTALGWPSSLSVLRHGESAGNVADDLAHERGDSWVDIEPRDMDVPLSGRGQRQARSVGAWLASRPKSEQPQSVISSPYSRARQTAELVVAEAGLESVPLEVDERLREREFGVLDRLTPKGIREREPDEWERRESLGKFYHRPPGGESWADVILRVRLLLDEVRRERADERVLLVGHRIGVMAVAYIVEGLDEHGLLELADAGDVPNCSLGTWHPEPGGGPRGRGGMRRVAFAEEAPVRDEDEPVTREDDAVPAGHR
jgi:2,3-bisphosphoglycerate-dependent phosphoglycerate mutase